MQVTFAKLAFIDGVRYRQGEQEYLGPIEKLPDDAKIDGKFVRDMSHRALSRAKTISDKDDAKPQPPVDEAKLRAEIETELRSDNEFLDKIREELRQEPALREAIAKELEPEVKAKLEAEKPKGEPEKPKVDPFKEPAKK